MTRLAPLRRAALPLAAAALLALAASLLGATAASASWFSPEDGGSPNADRIATLYELILGLAAIVFIGVEGVLIYSLIKFKARRGRVAAQIHGNTRLEIGWTIGAAVILVFITAVTFIQLNGIKDPEKTGADGLQLAGSPDGVLYASTDQPDAPGGQSLNIKVDGQQYIWRFQYPDREVYAYEEMVVPINTTVTLDITSDDVQHSWWIPELGGKMDALPGYTNETWFKVERPGIYEGQCAELCGRNHANMLARVRALPVAEYERWVADKKNELKTARDEAAKKREALLTERGSSPESQSEASGAAGSPTS